MASGKSIQKLLDGIQRLNDGKVTEEELLELQGYEEFPEDEDLQQREQEMAQDEEDREEVRRHYEACPGKNSLASVREAFEPPKKSLRMEPSDPFKDSYKLMDKICLQFGKNVPKLADDYKDLFVQSFRKRLERLNFKRPTPVQTHTWPSICKGRSVTCISGPKTGKTNGYLIPIIETFEKKASNRKGAENERGAGPLYVIVCSDTLKVRDVADNADRLIGESKAVTIASLSGGDSLDQKTLLYNGCHVLISTPGAILRALNEKVICLDACVLLVFDDGDRCLALHCEEVKQLLMRYFVVAKSRLDPLQTVSHALVVQTVVFAEKWTKAIESFVTNTQSNPVVIFGDYFEAAISTNIESKINYCDKEEKRAEVLLKVIESRKLFVDKIAIACCSESECKEVEQIIRRSKVGLAIVWHENCNHYEDQNLFAKWSSGSFILIISDKILFQIPQINDVQCLIHYTLPDEKKGMFSVRFRMMAKNLTSKDAVRLTHLILSPQNERQVHSLCRFVKRLKDQTLPPEVIQLQKTVKRQLCKSYASFGFCPFKGNSCLDRHSFATETADKNLPTEGQLKVFVTHVVTANEFYIRIHEIRNSSHSEGKWQPFPSSIKDIEADLEELKSSELNLVKKASEGDLFAVNVRGVVQRVRVTKILGEEDLEHYQDPKKRSILLRLFHIDFGHKSQARANQLIPLPPKLKLVPALAYKAYMCGVKPLDNAVDWDYKSNKYIYETVSSPWVAFLTAWVHLQLDRVFWLVSVRVMQKLTNLKAEVVAANLSKSLVHKNLAVENKKLTPNFGKNIDIQLKWQADVQLKASQKAFLGKNMSKNEAVLSHFVSLREFYLQLNDNVKIIAKLEDQIKASHLKRLTHFQQGLVCVSKYELNDSLNRALINQVNQNGTVNVFYVDYGETFDVPKEMCYEIDLKYISALPFQAIKCSIVGIQDCDGLSVDPDLIYDLTRQEDETLKRMLVQKVDSTDGVSQVRLFLEMENNEEHWLYHSVGKLLVDHEVAQFVDNEVDEVHVHRFLKEEDGLDENEKRCAANFLAVGEDEVEKLVKPFKNLMPNGYYQSKGLTSNGNSLSNGDLEEEEEEDDEQTSSRVKPKCDYRPGDFDYVPGEVGETPLFYDIDDEEEANPRGDDDDDSDDHLDANDDYMSLF